jgi:iron complex outermembrane receptor protein
MSRIHRRAGLMAGASFAVSAVCAAAVAAASNSDTVIVVGARSVAERERLPTTTESVTVDDLMRTVNVINTEDALKYLPNIFVRKRHVGDTQAPITTRTSGVGSGARSLIYADNVLLSALIGNNNSFASPKWGMVAPEEIERIDVLYGPFAAQYPGNSIGAVVEIQTRMPDHFTATAKAQTSIQTFNQYATKDVYPAYQLSALVGDRIGNFAWRASLNHLDSRSQPLAYVTATRPGSTSTSGTAVTGAFDDRNTLKFAYDIAPDIQAAYTIGLFMNNDRAGVESYLRNGTGGTVYSGSLNIGGYNYSVAASSFSNNIYRLDQTHWMHSLSLRFNTQGTWDWDIAGSVYDYGKDIQRIPSTALPGAYTGGAGSITDMDGTGWFTLDAKATWRPFGMDGANVVSFGGHFDRYALSNFKYNTADWLTGAKGALATAAKGHTETYALWVQDVWRFAPNFDLTVGGRYEAWHAFDGYNYSLSPALNVNQPELSASTFSPKASLSWHAAPEWTASASFGMAYRFPTVTELYQSITTGSVLTVPNPDLKPERALSGEVAVERATESGKVRVSLFAESISDALISQSAPLLANSTTLFNYVQNIDRVRSLGAEIVAQQKA